MNQLPQVCIIIPERNENSTIRTCLDAVIAQDYPQNLVSILVVDGISTDGTREILAEYETKHSFFKVIESPRKVVPPGFNMALRCTHADIIIRVDGHTVIAPDYVRQCVEALHRTKADNVGGKMNAVSTTRFGQAVAFATSTPFGVGGSRFHYSDKEEWVDSVYMGAWPRQVFEKIGLFDEELVRDQDDEFNYRLRQQGGRILLSPAIRSEYTVRSTPLSLFRQYAGYGYWKVRVLQKHPLQMSLRQFIPPAFILALFGSAFLLFFSFPSFIFHPSSFIIILYLLANLAASVWTVIKSTLAAHHSPSTDHYSLLILPFIFAILHLSYGLGFLIGLLKFWNRWGDKIGQTPAWSSEAIG
ncbi:MAG: glycosyltransferase family 2 protein [Planctomycetes bacterium]|nr:glycosyltransferase family 2 protein [Planctomycetota bacterium]